MVHIPATWTLLLFMRRGNRGLGKGRLCTVLHIVGLNGIEWDVEKETGCKKIWTMGSGEYVNWKSLCDPGRTTTDWLVYIRETDLSLRCLEEFQVVDLKLLISYV